MLGKHVVALSCGALGLVVANAALADEGEDRAATQSVRCISMGKVHATTIVDDDRLLFHQSGGRVYLSSLDQTCVGLTRSGKFSYKVQSGARHARLCATDTITVLERIGNGFSCGLGEFVPISAEAVAELLGTATTEQLERAVEVQPVELPSKQPAAAPKSE